MEQLHQPDDAPEASYRNVFPNPHQKHVYSALLYTCGLTTHPEARATADAWIHSFEARARESDLEHEQHLPVELYNQIILVHAQRAAEEYGAAAAAEDPSSLRSPPPRPSISANLV